MQDFADFSSENRTSGELDSQLAREWLAVNHLGGFACSTVPGLNTRKYHGLLVAAMSAPVRRMVLLSRVEETVVCDGWSCSLSCNEYPNSIYPRGDQSLRAFSSDPFPRWAYQGIGWTIEKSLRLIEGQNTVLISYTLLGGTGTTSIEFQARPMFALRGIHDLTYQWNGDLRVEDTIPGHHRIPPTGRTPEVFFAHDGVFEADAHWYLNTIYRREQERGYSGLEDLWNPGMVRWSLKPGQTVNFACSADVLDLEMLLAKAALQLDRSAAKPSRLPLDLLDPSDRLTLTSLLHAADQFVLDVPSPDGSVGNFVATQYPWSPPSPRLALIGFCGLFLLPGKFEQGKNFLLRMTELLVKGVLPSSLSESGGPPLYHGVDTSLWFINAVYHYFKYTGDIDTVTQSFFDAVMQVIRWYHEGTALGIRTDVDGLLLTNQPGVPTTWMDAQADGWVVTPRGGKAVEINALWYNALRVAAELARRLGKAAQGQELAAQAATMQSSFNRRFWNAATGCCYDVIDDLGADPAVRPNQLLALSLDYKVLATHRFEAVLEKVRTELLTPVGLRTLSPSDRNYAPHYSGDVVQRDRAHHQGSVFPWLLGPYVDAYLTVHGKGEGARREARDVLAGCLRYLVETGTGQLGELFDGAAPHRPGGAIAAAVSVAEVLRVFAQNVLMIQPAPPTAPASTQPPVRVG